MNMRVIGGAALCALASTTVLADGLYLDFEDPDASAAGIIDAPNPYFGTTWSTSSGDGLSDLGLMDVNWYNANYGASLTAVSGDQVGWSRFGEDNISVDLGGDYTGKHVYVTPWFGFGPPSLDVELYNDGGLVATINAAMVSNVWTFVDLSGYTFDAMNFSNNGGGTWWLMDDLTLNKVPAPGALALLGAAGLAARRRRRA